MGSIARIRKPHGTKGELSVWSLVDKPGRELDPGTVVQIVGEDGTVLAGPLIIVRRRRYHRQWLVTFKGIREREVLEGWRGAEIVAAEPSAGAG